MQQCSFDRNVSEIYTSTMKIRAKVDEKLCIGSGNCIILASKHFTLTKKGKALVKDASKKTGSELLLDVSDAEKKKLLDAARACPAQAILLTDEKGNKIN